MNTKVILARSSEGNFALARELEKVGLQPIQISTVEFEPPEDWSDVDKELRSIENYDWLVFTSSTSAKFFLDRIRTLRVQLPDLKIAAVGSKTAAVLTANGIRVDFIPSRFTTQRLAMELPKNGNRVLLLRADIADEQMLISLQNRGFNAKQVAVYRSVAVSSKYAYEEFYEAKAILFGSASEVRNFCRIVPEDLLYRLRKSSVAACIGPVTAGEAKAKGFSNILIPKEYTFESLILELIRYIERE
ncbi:MAG: uroporphyrinogen-III synthase [Conexivisphaerales archaeon]